MKSFISAVSPAFAVLFLAVSLSGCFDEGSKTASQSGGSSFFSSDGVSVPIPKFNQEKSVSIYFWGPSIAADPEIEKFFHETWAPLGRKSKNSKASLDGVESVAMQVTTKGGVSIFIPNSIVQKLHRYEIKISTNGSYIDGKEYARWVDGMSNPFIFP